MEQKTVRIYGEMIYNCFFKQMSRLPFFFILAFILITGFGINIAAAGDLLIIKLIKSENKKSHWYFLRREQLP